MGVGMNTHVCAGVCVCGSKVINPRDSSLVKHF